MSGIKLTWDIGSFNPEKHYIYRSDSPISPNNLPTPIAEVGQGINQYNDLSIADGETYHYFVAAEKKGLLCPADSSVSFKSFTYLGPGPQTLLAGDMTDGFFGEVSGEEMVTGQYIADSIGLTVGRYTTTNVPWLKFAIDGKILFIPKIQIGDSVNWEDIYQAGAVYGTDDFGVNPVGVPINQLSTIRFDSSDFIVRLIKGSSTDPSDGTLSNSEWSRTLYRVCSVIPNDQVGDNWLNYSEGEMNIDRMDYTWCQETSPTDSSLRLVAGRYGIEHIQFVGLVGSSIYDRNPDKQWRPVLELQL